MKNYIDTQRGYKNIIDVLFTVSGVVFTFIMTLNYAVYIVYDGYTATGDYKVQFPYAVIAAIIILPVYFYLCKYRDFVFRTLEAASVYSFFFSAFVGIFISLQLIRDTERNLSHILWAIHYSGDISSHDSIWSVGVWCACVLAALSIVVFVNYVVNLFLSWFLALFNRMDKYDKIYFSVTLFLSISLICFFHSKTTAVWNSLDLVYETDAIFIYDHYYSVFSFGLDFDWDIGCGGIRHPLATMITYPIYVVVSVVANLLFWIPNVQALLYAVVHSVLMILSAIMICKIVRNRWIYLFSALSFPFIFYSFFIEKYPIIVFFVVLYVYSTVKEKNEELQKYSLVAAGGMMITFALLGIFYGKGKRFRERLLEYNNAVMLFLLTMIGTGRIHYLLDIYRLLHQNSIMFIEDVTSGFTIEDKFCGFTNLMASCLIPVAYEETEWSFYWQHLTDRMNLFGLAVLFIVVYSCGRYIKNKKMIPFMFWIFVGGICQFFIIGCGTNAEPLFSLCFSWAVIPMLVLGIDQLVKKVKLRNAIYIGLLTVMFYMNYVHCQDLLAYLMREAPIGKKFS